MKSSLEPAFSARRVQIFTALLGSLFVVLIMRLYVLQVVRGDEYQQKSQDNFVQERRVAHARGLIFDQAGRVLVDNRPSHDVTVTVAFLPDSARTLGQLLAPLGLSRPELLAIDREVLALVETDEIVVVADDLGPEDCASVEERRARFDIRGADVETEATPCRVLLRPREFPSRSSVFRRLRDLVGLPPADMKVRVDTALQRASGLGKFKPTALLEDVGYVVYARIEQAIALGELPGVDVVHTQTRRYRNDGRAAHLLGYLNEISPDELRKQEDSLAAGTLSDDTPRYALGDLIGRRGVEGSYERMLRGKDGIDRVVVDAKGRDKGGSWAGQLLGDARLTPPVPGHSLVLALDDDLQATAEDAFGGVAGSVIAMEVDTGYVLALASFPTFDPNVVAGPWAREIKRALDVDKNRPWTNKAVQEHYAPGSTFKAITAAAGLREREITETSSRACPGYFRLGRNTWRCFNREGHGAIALVKALQYSCDSYFYSLGYDLGPDRLSSTARLFSFGSRTGIDIGGESPGIMPDRAYYLRRFGAYTPGLVVNNAIGQGDVTVTPLQLAVAYAAIANGGKVMKPQVVRQVVDAQGNVVLDHAPVQVADLGLPAHDLALLKEALAHVTEPGGTASSLLRRNDRYADMSAWLRESGLNIVGKTGTAQVVQLSKKVKHVRAEDVAYEQRDHAWFVGFAPEDVPEIVVVTMTEHGGFGGSTSGPVTAEVLRTWFTKVRGHGRYTELPPLEPARRRPAASAVVAGARGTTEESAPAPHGPEHDDGDGAEPDVTLPPDGPSAAPPATPAGAPTPAEVVP
ncbi:MAG: penicillin-binding protein 2 [Deltaproteobacteria bacterium]|nr:penicillin-binding protein 2 [Deltaproteobacteria bacterium]